MWSNLIGSANIPAVIPECVQQRPKSTFTLNLPCKVLCTKQQSRQRIFKQSWEYDLANFGVIRNHCYIYTGCVMHALHMKLRFSSSSNKFFKAPKMHTLKLIAFHNTELWPFIYIIVCYTNAFALIHIVANNVSNRTDFGTVATLIDTITIKLWSLLLHKFLYLSQNWW